MREEGGGAPSSLLPPPSCNYPVIALVIPERGGWTQKLINWRWPIRSCGALAMHDEPTTAIIQRYLDALPEDPAAEPIIRELLDRAVRRLRLLCANLLYRSYPRL